MVVVTNEQYKISQFLSAQTEHFGQKAQQNEYMTTTI